MPGAPFHRTEFGHEFRDATVRALERELARLNANLERLLVVVEGIAAEPQGG